MSFRPNRLTTTNPSAWTSMVQSAMNVGQWEHRPTRRTATAPTILAQWDTVRGTRTSGA
jgi:hypothetical protein